MIDTVCCNSVGIASVARKPLQGLQHKRYRVAELHIVCLILYVAGRANVAIGAVMKEVKTTGGRATRLDIT